MPRPANAATFSPATNATSSLTRDRMPSSSPRSTVSDRSPATAKAAGRHLNAVAEASAAKLAELERPSLFRRHDGLEAAIAVVKTDRGKDAMDRVRT